MEKKTLVCFLIGKKLEEVILGHKVSKSYWGMLGLQELST